MKPLFALFLLVFLHFICLANDGVFRVNGNQLIPMYETDISVQKEVLTIKRVGVMQAQITVYYEFFNPKEEKELEVGFEAFSPSGDVGWKIDRNGQPFISNFTVNLNDSVVPWQVAIVHDKSYYREGKIRAMTLAAANKEASENEAVDFFYVYHFKASFHKGVNILRHTYVVGLSSSVSEKYSLEYVLTAAKRWANKQIDDFTLQIDMGDYQDLVLPATFFKQASEWVIDGVGKSREWMAESQTRVNKENAHMAEFFIRKGTISFRKTNFKPAGELSLSEPNSYGYHGDLSFSIEGGVPSGEKADRVSKQVLHNLPFARRGYVFKSPELQAYYSREPWYMPDPGYSPAAGKLTKEEQELLK